MNWASLTQPRSIPLYKNEIPSLDLCEPLFKDVLVMDVGAFRGLWSVAALASGAKFVIAFEPGPIEDLGRSLYDFPQKYRIINAFITDSEHLGDGGYRITVDGFMEKERYNQVGFIKIDVEGHEIDVLRGAERTIRKHKPNMLIESHDYMKPGRDTEIITLLKEWGFEPFKTLWHGDVSQKTYHIVF